jgi:hypothetical protein
MIIHAHSWSLSIINKTYDNILSYFTSSNQPLFPSYT